MWMQTGKASDADLRVLAAGGFAFLMFIFSWRCGLFTLPAFKSLPLKLLPVAASDFSLPSMKPCGSGRASRHCPSLCLSFSPCSSLFGLGIALIVVAGASSLVLIFVALVLLALQVWMFGRFFVNVLFWQQFAVLENAGFVDSLRESRNFAHSGREVPWFQRPLWRGVFVASIWFAFVLAIALVSEWTTLQHSFNELMTTQDPQTLLQKLTEAQQAHGFDVLAFAFGILQKILQPLIGIAFVLVYIDSRRER